MKYNSKWLEIQKSGDLHYGQSFIDFADIQPQAHEARLITFTKRSRASCALFILGYF